MPDRPEPDPSVADAKAKPDIPPVTVCETSPNNCVFIEMGNRNGWIATDAAVTVRR